MFNQKSNFNFTHSLTSFAPFSCAQLHLKNPSRMNFIPLSFNTKSLLLQSFLNFIRSFFFPSTRTWKTRDKREKLHRLFLLRQKKTSNPYQVHTSNFTKKPTAELQMSTSLFRDETSNVTRRTSENLRQSSAEELHRNFRQLRERGKLFQRINKKSPRRFSFTKRFRSRVFAGRRRVWVWVPQVWAFLVRRRVSLLSPLLFVEATWSNSTAGHFIPKDTEKAPRTLGNIAPSGAFFQAEWKSLYGIRWSLSNALKVKYEVRNFVIGSCSIFTLQ